MIPQILSTCFTSTMEYINHELCGGSLSENTLIEDYHNSYGDWIPFTGVDDSNAYSFIADYFDIANISYVNIQNAIDLGIVVMTNVWTEIEDVTHSIAIVGYHPDGKLIYMNPQTGQLEEDEEYNVGATYEIGISGCN